MYINVHYNLRVIWEYNEIDMYLIFSWCYRGENKNVFLLDFFFVKYMLNLTLVFIQNIITI